MYTQIVYVIITETIKLQFVSLLFMCVCVRVRVYGILIGVALLHKYTYNVSFLFKLNEFLKRI